MREYDDLVGSMLIGSWLAAMLYGLTVCKTWEYVARSNMLWLAVFLAICVVVGLVGAIIISVTLAGADYSARNKAATGVVVFTVGTAGADILIALALIWKLVTIKTSFINPSPLIHRLVVGAIRTGSTTSTIAVVVVMSYYINNESNVPTAFNYLMSPMYVVTLLYNLNLQRRDGPSGSGPSVTGRSDNRVTDISLGVQFRHTTVVTMDSAVGNAPRTVDPATSYGETKVKEDTNSGPFTLKSSCV
ncbi:hypothetical protein C8J57DRAFT_1245562 [Mycena rebaudengoi]|nr:hypothetical protein C8J57DRAFT_1245562 [Mycena rebaudengoi]